MKNYLIAGLLGVCIVQQFSLYYWHTKVLAYEKTVAQLKADSDRWHQQYEEAHKRALEALFNSNREVDNIMAADVSKNCTEAIQWGVTQAKRIS